MATHVCAGSTPKALFCVTCGQVLDRAALRSVKFRGFTGPASVNPKVEQFWATGDASVFDPPGLQERLEAEHGL